MPNHNEGEGAVTTLVLTDLGQSGLWFRRASFTGPDGGTWCVQAYSGVVHAYRALGPRSSTMKYYAIDGLSTADCVSMALAAILKWSGAEFFEIDGREVRL